MTVDVFFPFQLKEHFSLPYSSFYFKCHLFPQWKPFDFDRVTVTEHPERWTNLSASENFVRVHPQPESAEVGGSEGKIAMCIKPFHYDWNRAIWLVEFLELYKLLGVRHFVFYNHTLGKDVEAVQSLVSYKGK